MSKKLKRPKKFKDRIMDTKWKSLEARGYTRPANAEENHQRAMEAHIGSVR